MDSNPFRGGQIDWEILQVCQVTLNIAYSRLLSLGVARRMHGWVSSFGVATTIPFETAVSQQAPEQTLGVSSLKSIKPATEEGSKPCDLHSLWNCQGHLGEKGRSPRVHLDLTNVGCLILSVFGNGGNRWCETGISRISPGFS